MLAISAQIAFNHIGVEYENKLISIFKAAGDEFTRCSQAAAWMNYVEKAPFNLKCFNHWHFLQEPYNTSSMFIPEHINDDDLITNIKNVYKSLSTQQCKRSWPFAMSMKVLLASIADIFSPLHVTELFNQDFPNGDDNGRNFYVQYNGKQTTLFDIWETGCGLYPKDFVFNEANWKIIDEDVKKILNLHPFPVNNTSFNENFIDNVKSKTRTFTIEEIYQKSFRNQPLPQSQILTCQKETQQKMAEAGFAMAEALKNIILITPGEPTVLATTIRTSEVIAWSILCILAPFASFLIWKVHFA